jgi:hypothetical protein
MASTTSPFALGSSRTRAVHSLAGSLAAGVLTEALVDRTRLGAGWFLLSALLVGATLLLFGGSAGGRVRITRAAGVAAVIALALGGALVWRESAWTAALAVPASALALLALPFLLGCADAAGELPRALAQGLRGAPAAAVESAKMPLQALDAVGRPRGQSLWRGLLLGLPIAGGFALLLSADARFSAALSRGLHRSGGAAHFAALSALFAAAFLFWYVLHDRARRQVECAPAALPVPYRTQGDAPSPSVATAYEPLVRPLTWAVVLVQVCLVFALFGAVNARELFAGHALARAKSSVTYAQYLHSGFTQLSIATALAVATVLVGHVLMRPRGAVRVPGGVKLAALETALLALTGAALFSSLVRVRVYETAYGYTHLRLGVQLVDAGVLVLLVLTLVKAFARAWRGFAGALVAAGGVLAVVAAWFDADLYVARGNLDRAQAQLENRADPLAWRELDVGYLTALGPDAMPALAHPHLRANPALAAALEQAWRAQADARRREGWRAYRGLGWR